MPPRRPPKLDPGLFAPGGPLSPGSAPPVPPASTIHPDFLVDGHCIKQQTSPDGTESSATTELFAGLPVGYAKPPVKGVLQVRLDDEAVASREPGASTIRPIVLDLSATTTPAPVSKDGQSVVDIIVPSSTVLQGKGWDVLEEMIGSMGTGRKIVISGILPPPLSKASGSLPRDEGYQTFLARIANLSLNAHVYLKALPPVVASASQAESKWWEDDKELRSVIKMYLSPIIEAFGTHRIIFGSSPAMQPSAADGLERPVSSSNWYALLRQCVSELGEGQEVMTAIMGGTATSTYSLA